MPRLGVSISETFDSKPKVARPDRYGRRVRHVSGVEYVREKPARPLRSLFFRITATLALLAIIAMSAALWRLFSFPH